MKEAVNRLMSLFMAAVFVASAMMTGTFSWQSVSQQAQNEKTGQARTYAVELLKLEKLTDGTLTQTPVPGATFYLYTADGKQIGGRYVSDADGKIAVQLPKGDYYFEEADPGPSHTFDTENGQRKTRYPFTVTGGGSAEVTVVTAYNVPLEGPLTIRKIVQNADGSPLTEEQEQKLFEFTVTFSDNGTYDYRIDGGELQTVASGGKIYLKHGQTAVFENIPVGVLYNVTETPEDGYITSSSGHRGNITEEGCVAAFVNTRDTVPPEETGKLTVTKQLAGEFPEADLDKEFHFTLIVDGKETQFTLKPGETIEFELPAGANYEIREDDCFEDGYSQSIVNGSGTIIVGLIEAVVTNTFVGTVMVEISGEKTWDLAGYPESVKPDSILVRLMDGDRVVEEITVTPDENGEWHYTFTAPKYDAQGNEITYTVEEVPLYNFIPSYDGYNIHNTYLPPVSIDPPILQKLVKGDPGALGTKFEFLLRGSEGAPMPEGSDGNTKILTMDGSGEMEIGKITFDRPGTFIYTVTELNGGVQGWEYDTAVYTLTVTVTVESGRLVPHTVLTKNGETASALVFINTYERVTPPDKTVVSGRKTWNHGNNPNPPESIIVYVYADGVLCAQRQVTAGSDWAYVFELPKYAADGREIVYTIDEADVPGYDKAINGYDLVNTYHPATTPEPGDPDGPQTGDRSNLGLWLAIMLCSLFGLIVTVLAGRRKRYAHRHGR